METITISANPLDCNDEYIFNRPIPIAEYSVDRDAIIVGRRLAPVFTKDDLQTVVNQKKMLNEGYSEAFLQKNIELYSNRSLKPLQKFLTLVCPKGTEIKEVLQTQFVMFRGTLTRLAGSINDIGGYSDGLKIACIKFKGIIFILELDTNAKKMRLANMSKSHKVFSFAGIKFEALLNKCEVEDLIPFYSLMKGTIASKAGGLSILYAAETDGIWQERNEYLEFKTMAFNKTSSQNAAIVADPNKIFKWMWQCISSNVEEITIGLHNKFELCAMRTLKVGEILQIHKDDYRSSMNFSGKFLKIVLQLLENQIEGTVLMAERLPDANFFKTMLLPAKSATAMDIHQMMFSAEFLNHGWR